MQNSRIITKNDLKNKRVLVRVDFNLPIENGMIRDNTRIKNAYSTIKFLQEAQAKIILISHLGKTTFPCPNQSLKLVVDEGAKIYESKVIFIDDCLSETADRMIDASLPDDLILLENLRFYPEEEKCDMGFARHIAQLADFYINEAFSVSHREHASIVGVPQILPHALGLSFQKEIRLIDDFFQNAKSPAMCIVGGAKLSSKINLLKNLVKKVDKLAIGGRIAGAFLPFLGNSSLKISNQENYEKDVAEIVENAKRHDCELIMPVDFTALVASEDNNIEIFDIGLNTIELFKRHIKESRHILWNGPVGLFEKAPFDFGTMSIAKYIAQLTKDEKLVSIAGGGDTGFAMNKFKVASDLSHVSTAGGAFLSYIEGNKLSGIAAMKSPYVLQK